MFLLLFSIFYLEVLFKNFYRQVSLAFLSINTLQLLSIKSSNIASNTTNHSLILESIPESVLLFLLFLSSPLYRHRLLLSVDSSIVTTRLQHVTLRLRSGLCSIPFVLSTTQLTAAKNKWPLREDRFWLFEYN